MADIGVRELKTHASEVVRKVHEKRERYVVTHRGHPVAVIIPVEEVRLVQPGDISPWDELVALGEQISQGWQSAQSSTDLLAEMRR
jgi:prevent-host-death family protein